ncbi:MAG TPA: sugar phosphate isomerase/epimerase family protein [Opitutus sp.]|nr:sugar phosphate isomerase/epimerase family protein [Opitutus sp.]
MKAGISVWSFPAAMELEQKFRLAKAAGFEGFEIDLTEDGPVRLQSSPAELRAVRALAEKHGLQLAGLTTGLYWGANAASAQRANVARAAMILDRQLAVAAALGVDAILVVPGAVGVDFMPGAEVVPYGAAYERARSFVGAAVSTAEKLRITIGIENVWNKFLLSPREMVGFIDSFGSERVGSYLDVGNALATGYPQHWIELLGRRIARVHFKDYRRAVGTVDGFVELLSGDVDWPAVMAALRAAGYGGWCTAEMIPPVPFYKHAPEVLIANTGAAMRAIFDLR